MKAVIAGLQARKPLESPLSRQGWLLLLAAIPAAVIGFLLKDIVELAFSSPTATSIFLLSTAALLLIAETVGKRNRKLTNLDWRDALWIGFAQVLSIFPGVSRSGATIAGGMTRDLERHTAARFSFLMSIPILALAAASALLDLYLLPNTMNLIPVYIPGLIAAAVVGYLSIRWLIGYLTRHSLLIFAVYCFLLGILIIIVSLLR